MPIYRRLVRGGMAKVLKAAYPIAASAPIDWEGLIDAFIREEMSTSPYLWQMPRGLLDFVRDRGWGPPYLTELLHFEWQEVELLMEEDREPMLLNPHLRIDHYTYPVFKVRPEKLEAEVGSYHLVSYRHLVDLDVRFVEVSPSFAKTLEEIRALEKLKLPISNDLCQKGIEFFNTCQSLGIVLGFDGGT